jgi:FkbM family methyltransferase
VQRIKRAIKKTKYYELFLRLRTINALRKWTARDQKMLEFYSQFINPGSLCFDVGANIGNRVKVFLKLGSRVVAVEPQDECIRILNSMKRYNNLILIKKALGDVEGHVDIMINDINTISSISNKWIESVSSSGRFSRYGWNKKQSVEMTTLDNLVHLYGKPSFIKIDVEGSEYQVLKGLSQSVKALSLEFIPEYMDSTVQCIKHLQQLGEITLNYSLGETMQWDLNEWVGPDEIVKILECYSIESGVFGDLYVRFQT